MARITAFNPGQSPPPVRIPIFMLSPLSWSALSAGPAGSVKMIRADLRHLGPLRPELRIDVQGREFRRADQHVVHLILAQERRCIWSPGVHALDLGLPLRRVQPAGPHPSSITHQRAPPGKEHRRIKPRRVQHDGAWRYALGDPLRYGHAVAVELAELVSAGDYRQNVQNTGKQE